MADRERDAAASMEPSPLVKVLLATGGYVVRDPEFVALVQNVVRCLGCDRLRVKHPDGHDAMCPWCRSNSSAFVHANPLEFEERDDA